MLPRKGLLVCLACAAMCAQAQNPVATATRTAELQAMSEVLQRRDGLQRQAARAWAQSVGVPMRRELPNGRVLELQRVPPGQSPQFYLTYNLDAADTVSTDELWTGGSAGLNLGGSGMTIAQWDGGAIDVEHPDLFNRVTQMDGAFLVSGHSTHVAGTLVGSGEWLVPGARGMAPAAFLDAWDWISDTAEMAAAAADGQLVSNHSYGIAAGWIYIGKAPPETWWWIGGPDPADVEDPYFGYYDTETQLWDEVAFNAPHYLIVKAAGNDRDEIGASPGEEYTVVDQVGEPLFTSTLPRQPDCWPEGYDCLPTTSVAKNILTIGAVDDVPGGYAPLAGPAQVSMTTFSSWGPTDDGRIKPDLVGNGMFLLSTYPPSTYAAAAGTSMAAPNVTGSLLLLQEHWENLHGPNQFMRAATLKALAIHTADEAGDHPGPDYSFGWGLLNTRKAAEVISEDGGDHQIIEGSLAQGATDTYLFDAGISEPKVTATLVWTDPPGTPPTFGLDPPDLMLVNDLDLRVEKGPATFMPWVLDPANPSAAATTGDNFRDNVEQVEITGQGTGIYTIEVSHKGLLQGGASQAYALIISVDPAPPTGSGLLIDEDFSGGLPPGWSVQTNVGGAPWTIFADNPADPRYQNKTTGSGHFAMVDVDYSLHTVTSLRTPVLDLSSATAAVLSFKSQYNYDLWETLNVDVSTNGGTSWGNAWNFEGFNPFPTTYVLDLSGAIAGQASAMIRFRFDSVVDPVGDYWQIDDVQLEVYGGGGETNPPGPASNPSPANGASGVDVNADLGWSAGAGTDSHDVYFGASSPPAFIGNQPGTGYNPGTLSNSTTYYWRIDEVNADGTTTGAQWSFTTADLPPPEPPDPATNPTPANGASGVDVDADLGWSAGAGADTHELYFGTVSPPPFVASPPGNSYDPGTLAHTTTYFWRVDEVNADGTTTGTQWSFTTASPPPPVSLVHVAAIDGWGVAATRGRWNAIAETTVVDQYGTPLGGVTVNGSWSSGASGGSSCVTAGNGRCQVAKNNLKGNVGSVVFGVDSLVATGHDYDANANIETSQLINQGDTPPTGNNPPSAVIATPVDCTDLACNFDGSGSGDSDGSIVGYSWDFGDGNGSTAVAPSHSYADPGTYAVSLTVTDDDGEQDTANTSVTVSIGGGTPTTVSVVSIVVDTLALGGGQKAPRAVVTIEDDLGNAVGAATVTGDFTGTAADAGVSAVSNGSGSATLTSGNSAKGKVNFTFCVTSITHGTLTYDSTDNNQTCAAL